MQFDAKPNSQKEGQQIPVEANAWVRTTQALYQAARFISNLLTQQHRDKFQIRQERSTRSANRIHCETPLLQGYVSLGYDHR